MEDIEFKDVTKEELANTIESLETQIENLEADEEELETQNEKLIKKIESLDPAFNREIDLSNSYLGA